MGGGSGFKVACHTWFESGFVDRVSKLVEGSDFMASFTAIPVLATWPGFKFGFKVCFSIGIFPDTDDVLLQTCFRGVSMSTRLVSESSCPDGFKAGFKPGFKVWFQIQFQTTVPESTCQVKI